MSLTRSWPAAFMRAGQRKMLAGVEAIMVLERRRQTDRAIEEGYRRIPPTTGDHDAAIASASRCHYRGTLVSGASSRGSVVGRDRELGRRPFWS